MIPDPFQSQNLVVKSLVSGGVVGLEVEEAERAETVVDGDENNAMIKQEIRTIESAIARSNTKRSA